MGITTRGFGQGAITTVGFGLGAQVAARIRGVSRRVEPLVLDAKLATACKITDIDWLARISDAAIKLSGIDSQVTRIYSLLRILEGKDPLLVDVEGSLDCKIDETDFDDKRAVADTELDSIDSRLAGLRSRLSQLETSLRIYLRKSQP